MERLEKILIKKFYKHYKVTFYSCNILIYDVIYYEIKKYFVFYENCILFTQSFPIQFGYIHSSETTLYWRADIGTSRFLYAASGMWNREALFSSSGVKLSTPSWKLWEPPSLKHHRKSRERKPQRPLLFFDFLHRWAIVFVGNRKRIPSGSTKSRNYLNLLSMPKFLWKNHIEAL